MADRAHRQTDKILEQMERELSAIYRRASKEMGETWSEYLTESSKKIEDLQALFDEYKAMPNKSTDDLEVYQALGRELRAAKRERTLLDEHYKKLTEQTAEQIAHIHEMALDYVNGKTPKVYALNYNALESNVDGIKGYSFELVDENTVKNLIENGDKTLLPTKKLNIAKEKAWNVKNINAEVLQGIIQGEPMDKIASRLMNVEQMSHNAAIRNARTMVTGAENKGRLDSYEKAEKDGIVIQKQWMATKDSRTRHWHSELDGVSVDIDKPFENEFGEIMFPGDPHADPANVYNCRCTMVADVVGFRNSDGTINKI